LPIDTSSSKNSSININETSEPSQESYSFDSTQSSIRTLNISTSSSMRTANTSTQRSASNAHIEFSKNKVSLGLEILPPELSVDDLIRLSKKKEFPTKHLIVDNKIKKYTPALHFFDSTRIFKKHP
jgi:hypothetical protein